jgi:hypothetical protein
MAQPVQVRPISNDEGNRLLRIEPFPVTARSVC